MLDDTEDIHMKMVRPTPFGGTIVRLYYFDRMLTGTSPAQNGIGCLNWPYLDGALYGVDRPTTSKPAPTKANYVLIQCSAPVNFEAVPQGRSNTVTGNSPIIEGDVILPCGPGWTFQFLNTEG